MTGTEVELAANGGVLPAYEGLADRIAKTEFVPKGLRGRPEAVLACILYGHEVGMGPMQSLSSIDIIEGKPTVKPEAMRGLVRQAGHLFRVEKHTKTAATVAGCRKEDPENWERVTWTIDDEAKAAGLSGKDAWKKYPRAMLLARATSELCRSMFSDVIAGLSYTAEEIDFRNALDMLDVVEVASIEERVRMEEAVAALSDEQRTGLVARWKEVGLGSLRMDAAAPLLAEQVDEAWTLINEAAGVVDGDAFPADDGAPLPDNPMSQSQNRMLFALLAMANIGDEERHLFASQVLGRTVGSFVELSADDGRALIDRLNEVIAEAPFDDDDPGRPFDDAKAE